MAQVAYLPVGKREQTKVQNRQAILDAAREVFGEMGYEAATVRDIIRRTGLAAGTFYNYYRSKEEVFAALADDGARRFSPVLKKLRAESAGFEDFVRLRPGDRMDRYLQGPAPSWEAYFFYRHGQRYDDHHARCPVTSATLESLDLFRVPGQAPEICFSLLKPHTEILPHHGVCNARVVMHLPLLVPPGCALNLVDIGAREWREGELLMFDDTYLHSAWNRSDHLRVILLMDCWNPHLTPPERDGVVRLTQLIGELDFLFSDKGWPATTAA